jgi:hypothetical protein
MEKNTVFLANVPGKTWMSTCIGMKLDPYFSPCTKSNSKLVKDVNVIPDTLKVLEENTEETLQVINIGNDFLNRIPIAQEKNSQNVHMGLHQIKKLLLQQRTQSTK